MKNFTNFTNFKQNALTCTIYLLFLSILALACGIYLHYSLDSLNTKLSMLLVAKKEAIEDLKSFRAIYLDKEKFSHYEEEHMRRLDFVKKKLPQAMNTEFFLHDLARVATNTKVEILETQVKDAIKEDAYQKQIIKLRCSGDFFALQAFFRDLEQEMQFVEIKNLKIEAVRQGEIIDEELISDMEIVLYAHAY